MQFIHHPICVCVVKGYVLEKYSGIGYSTLKQLS